MSARSFFARAAYKRRGAGVVSRRGIVMMQMAGSAVAVPHCVSSSQTVLLTLNPSHDPPLTFADALNLAELIVYRDIAEQCAWCRFSFYIPSNKGDVVEPHSRLRYQTCVHHKERALVEGFVVFGGFDVQLAHVQNF
jgi:hypothetical protein